MSRSATVPHDELSPEAFQAATGVSRETLDRLIRYHDLLLRWNQRINLIGASTASDAWRRHFLDSAQLVAHIPSGAQTAIDYGSGAGFPGLVIAAMTDLDVHLVESDQRKCAFLREAARVMGIDVTVHARRIEAAALPKADLVMSRALAPLKILIDYAEKHLKFGGIGLFLKGNRIHTELTESEKLWHIQYQLIPSLTDPTGYLLKLEDMRRVDQSHPS